MRSNELAFLAGILTLGVCLGLAIGLPSHAHAGLVVDSFLTPGDGSVFYVPGLASMGPGYPNNPYFRQDSGVGILGGQGMRELLAKVVGDGPFPFNAAVGWMPSGELHLATFGTQGAQLDLTYFSDPGAIDLTGGGENSMFVVRFSSLDPGFGDFLRLVTTVTDTEGTEAIHAIDLAECVTATSYELPFGDFAFADPPGSPSGNPFDVLKNAESIRFSFNAYEVPYTNIDFGVLSILAVPEPSGAILGGAGLLVVALLGSSRHRRQTRRDQAWS